MAITTEKPRRSSGHTQEGNVINLAEVRVQDGESIEAALRRFKKEVIRAGIILEVKKRKHYESKRQRKKRKKEESKRKATLAAKYAK